MEDKFTDEELAEVAMQIILHAGNARNLAKDALAAAKKGGIEAAQELMGKADAEILEAHKAQTTTVQEAMAGKECPYSVLFSHAQDTLMTIMSELNLSRELVDVLAIVYAVKEEM